jgi:hypothetical protein
MRARVARLLPGEAAPGPGGLHRITVKPPDQRTAAGVVRRLNRDRPDLAQAVAEGRISANAAAIEAGFRRRKVSVPVDNPASVVRALHKHLSPEQLTELRRLLPGLGQGVVEGADRLGQANTNSRTMRPLLPLSRLDPLRVRHLLDQHR